MRERLLIACAGLALAASGLRAAADPERVALDALVRNGVVSAELEGEALERALWSAASERKDLAAAVALEALKSRGADGKRWHRRYLELLVAHDFRKTAARHRARLAKRGVKVPYPGEKAPQPATEYTDLHERWVERIASGDVGGQAEALVEIRRRAVEESLTTYRGPYQQRRMGLWYAMDRAMGGLPEPQRNAMALAMQETGDLQAPPASAGNEVMAFWRRWPFAEQSQAALLAYAERLLRAGRIELARRCIEDVLDRSLTDDGAARAKRLRKTARASGGKRGPGETAASWKALERRKTLAVPVEPLWSDGVDTRGRSFPPLSLQARGGEILAAAPRLLAYFDAEKPGEPLWVRRSDARPRRRPGRRSISLLGGRFSPEIADERIYTRWGHVDGQGESGVQRQRLAHVSALDRETGRLLWSTAQAAELDDLIAASDPTLSEGRVYFLATSRPVTRLTSAHLVCLDAESGRLEWRLRITRGRAVNREDAHTGMRRSPSTLLSSYGNAPAVADGVVYASTASGEMVACDARDGLLLWRRGSAPTGGWRQWAHRLGAEPVVDGDRVVFVTRARAGVRALARESGELVWRNPFVPADRVVGAHDGLLIVRAGRRLAAVDLETGSTRWWSELPARVRGTAKLSGDRIVASVGDAAIALDAATGEIEAKRPWDGQTPLTKWAAAAGSVFVPRHHAAGRGAPRPKEPSAPSATRLVTGEGDRAWLWRADGLLQAHDLAKGGELRWRRFHRSERVAVAGEKLVLSGGRSGLLRGVRPDTGELAWEIDALARARDAGMRARCVEARVQGLGDLVRVELRFNLPEHKWQTAAFELGYSAETGELRWTAAHSAGDDPLRRHGSPLVVLRSGDRIYAYLRTGHRQVAVLTRNAQTGERVGEMPTMPVFEVGADMAERGLLEDRKRVPLHLPPERDREAREERWFVAGRYFVLRLAEVRGPEDPRPARYLIYDENRRSVIRAKARPRTGGDDVWLFDNVFHLRTPDGIRLYDMIFAPEIEESFYRTEADPITGLHRSENRVYLIGRGRVQTRGRATRRPIVEVFDAKSTETLRRIELPVAAGRVTRDDFAVRGETLWLAVGNGLEQIDLGGGSAPPGGDGGALVHRAGGPVRLDGELGDWAEVDHASFETQTPAGPARLRVTHDQSHLLVAVAAPDAAHRPFWGAGRFGGGGDWLETTVIREASGPTSRRVFAWDVGLDPHGRTAYARRQRFDPRRVRARVRHDAAAGRLRYEYAVPLETIRGDPRQAIRLGARLWNGAGDGPRASWREIPLYLHNYTREQDKAALRLAAAIPPSRVTLRYVRDVVNAYVAEWPADRENLVWLLERAPEGPLALLLLGQSARRIARLGDGVGDRADVLAETARRAGFSAETIKFFRRKSPLLFGGTLWASWDELNGGVARQVIEAAASIVPGEEIDRERAKRLIREQALALADTRAGYRFFRELLESAAASAGERARELTRFLHQGPASPFAGELVRDLYRNLREEHDAERAGAIVERVVASAGVARPEVYRALRRASAWEAPTMVKGWSAIGPFPLFASPGGGKRLPEELDRVTLKEFYTLDGETIRWQPVPDTGTVDLREVLGEEDVGPARAYAITWIRSDRGRRVALELHNSGPARLWVNQRRVPLPAERGDERIVRLRKGWNRVLVRIASQDPGRASGAAGAPRSPLFRAPEEESAWQFRLDVVDPYGLGRPEGLTWYEPAQAQGAS